MQSPGLFTIDSGPVKAAAAALQRAGTEANGKIIQATAGTMSAAFGEEISRSAGSAVQQAVIGAGAESHGSGFGLEMSANHGTTLSGGTITPQAGRGFEFGSLHAGAPTTYTQRSRNGKRYTVTRQSDRQMPTRSTRGWVAYPAASRVFPRVLQMWMQIIVKTAHDAIEKGVK